MASDNSYNSYLTYDPNGALEGDELHWAQRLGGSIFRNCKIEPKVLSSSTNPCNSLLLGVMGTKRYIIYVRVTRRIEEEEGTGPMPMVLFDTAKELNAEPLLVRLNIKRIGQGFGFEYFGFDEVTQLLKSNTKEWNSLLLKGRSVEDYHRLVKGTLTRLELMLQTEPQLQLQLLLNNKQVSKHTISLTELIKSTHTNEEYRVFTCSCGVPECANIYGSVVVVAGGDLLVWKCYCLIPRRIFVFNRKEYRAEILQKARMFLHEYKQLHPDWKDKPEDLCGGKTGCYFWSIKGLEQTLYDADEARVA